MVLGNRSVQPRLYWARDTALQSHVTWIDGNARSGTVTYRSERSCSVHLVYRSSTVMSSTLPSLSNHCLSILHLISIGAGWTRKTIPIKLEMCFTHIDAYHILRASHCQNIAGILREVEGSSFCEQHGQGQHIVACAHPSPYITG